MGGSNIAVGDVTGNVKNQNNSTIFESEAIYPDANGTIHFELARHVGSFAHINAMKIEEYSVAYAEGTSPLISTTSADGTGVRVARIIRPVEVSIMRVPKICCWIRMSWVMAIRNGAIIMQITLL